MLTSTMTPEESIRELEKDIHEIYTYLEKKNYRSKFIRRAIKHNSDFPISTMYQYQTTHHINWVIQFIANGKRKTEEIIYAIYKTPIGYSAYRWYNSTQSWSIYSAHFFQRYNKRFLTQNYDEPFYGLDILSEYFQYNSATSNHSDNSSKNPALQGPSTRFKQKDKEDKNTIMFTHDGIGLGIKKEKDLFIYSTFISFDLIKDHQLDEVSKLMLGHQIFTDYKRNNGSYTKHKLNSEERVKRAELVCKSDLFDIFENLDDKLD